MLIELAGSFGAVRWHFDPPYRVRKYVIFHSIMAVLKSPEITTNSRLTVPVETSLRRVSRYNIAWPCISDVSILTKPVDYCFEPVDLTVFNFMLANDCVN